MSCGFALLLGGVRGGEADLEIRLSGRRCASVVRHTDGALLSGGTYATRERCPRSRDLGQDVACLGRPDEGLRVQVVLGDVVLDGFHQGCDALEGAAPDALGRDVPEEALDHVEPGRAGRREMHVEARMATQPLLHSGVLVRPVVVGDHVDLEGRRAVARCAHAEDLTRQRVQCGEERGRAVPLVVVA